MTFRQIIKTVEPLLRLIAIFGIVYFGFIAFGTIQLFIEHFGEAVSILLFAE